MNPAWLLFLIMNVLSVFPVEIFRDHIAQHFATLWVVCCVTPRLGEGVRT